VSAGPHRTMKGAFKLYWVETPSPEENCFVAARSKRAAARYEEYGTGFDPGSCSAALIRSIEPEWIKQYCGKVPHPEGNGAAFYVQPEDLHQLDVKWSVVEGDDVFEYHSHQYVKQGDFNYLASLGTDPKNMIIRSVADLLEINCARCAR
jgi:hypothetical protein